MYSYWVQVLLGQGAPDLNFFDIKLDRRLAVNDVFERKETNSTFFYRVLSVDYGKKESHSGSVEAVPIDSPTENAE